MERKMIPMEELMPVLQLQMEQGGLAPLTVTGSSMLPMLTPLRDRVWLKPCCDQLRSGDLILFRRDCGKYVLHRIVRLSQGILCCGDNQWQTEPVRQDQVVALVAAFERKGKSFAVDAFSYRFYVWLTVTFFFLRRPYIAVRRFLGKLRRSLRK